MEESLVIIPLVSLYIHDRMPAAETEKLFALHQFQLLEKVPDLKLVVFNQASSVSQGINLALEKNGIEIDGTLIDARSLDQSKRFPFTSALVSKILFKDPGTKVIMGDNIENTIRSAVQLLRLYIIGDIFAPISIIQDFGTYPLPVFNRAEEHESNSSISLSKIPHFVKFFRHYSRKMAKLHKLSKENKYLESWYKRINNAFYFFNESYFSRQSNVSTPGQRNGNAIRLINLISALDALCGKDANGEKLSKNVFFILGKIYPKIEQTISDLYDLRSNFIHANPDRLVNKISDQTIKELGLYLQKLILINLELLTSRDFRVKFVKSSLKNYFEYLERIQFPGELKDSIQSVFSFDDEYGWPHNTQHILDRWA